jgi:hypothetical protein
VREELRRVSSEFYATDQQHLKQTWKSFDVNEGEVLEKKS